MNKKLLFEFALVALFLLAGICAVAKVPHVQKMVLISGGLLSAFYFYGPYWLFKQDEAPAITRLVAGFSYAEVIISCMFCLLHWQFWKVFMAAACLGLAVTAALCVSKYKLPGYLLHLCRCVFFFVVLGILFAYKQFHF